MAAVLLDSYPFYQRSSENASVQALAVLQAHAALQPNATQTLGVAAVPAAPNVAVPLKLIQAVEKSGAVVAQADGSFLVKPAELAQAVPDEATQLFRSNLMAAGREQGRDIKAVEGRDQKTVISLATRRAILQKACLRAKPAATVFLTQFVATRANERMDDHDNAELL